MKYAGFALLAVVSLSVLGSQAMAQKASAAPGLATVPRMVNFSGRAVDVQGRPITGITGITFAIYNGHSEGAPLWLETQNVQPDGRGNYSVQLGATKSEGLPLELFASGEARWLGVRVNGDEEQPRVLLLSVPYALQAADAQTLGGLPPSAFVLAAPGAANINSVAASASSPQTTTPPVGGTGTQNYIPIWTDSTGDLGNSILYQLGTGTSAKIGINEKSPLFTLDVNGQELVRGLFEMATMNYATKTKGYNSQPFNLESSAYNSGTANYTLNHFQWQAEPVGNNTSTPGATLNLLYGTDPALPAETGLKLSNTGVFTFAAGQTFPGTGTVSSVGSGAGLTGGPITSTGTLSIATAGVSNAMLANPSLTVSAGTDLTGGGSVALGGTTTLNLDTTKVPQLKTANTFTGNQTVNGNLTSTGVVTGGSYQIGSDLFGFGSHVNLVAFLGFSGNSASTGEFNTGVGAFALGSNTTGFANTAVGGDALFFNVEGGQNTAVGFESMAHNTGGDNNTAYGYEALYTNTTGTNDVANGPQALYSNTTGTDNEASGDRALINNTTGNANTGVGSVALAVNSTGSELTCIGFACGVDVDGLVNATAIGNHASVGESNALVLGGTFQYAVKVGIGTTTPSNILTIARNAGFALSDGWQSYSSRRWKTNIQTLPDALAKVEQLRGVSYDLKDSGKHEIGVIAEEVGKVLPEVVSYEKNGQDASGVDYSRLTAVLIEAVKQQQKQIAAQREQVRILRTKLSQLRGTVDELRQANASDQKSRRRDEAVIAKSHD